MFCQLAFPEVQSSGGLQMQRSLATVLVTALWTFAADGRISAQEAAPKDPGVRMLYCGRNLSVQDLAIFLSKAYEREEGIRFTAAPSANVLSIRTATTAQMDNVLKELEIADRPKQLIEFQAVLIDVAVATDGTAPPGIEAELLKGSAGEVLKTAREWVREGKVARARAYTLTTLDNQIGSTATTEIIPRLVSSTTTSLGTTPRTTADQKLGVTFSVVPRVNDKNEILCELMLDPTELADRPATERGSGDDRVRPKPVVQERTQTTVRIPNGHSVVVSGRDGDAISPNATGLLVVSATIVEPQTGRK